MNMEINIAIIIGIFLAILLLVCLVKQPVYITVNHPFMLWSLPILACFVGVLLSFTIDLFAGYAAEIILTKYETLNGADLSLVGWISFWALNIIDSGFLILVFVAITSKFVGWIAKKSYLVYMYSYSVNVLKWCFTILTILLTIRLFGFVDWNGQLTFVQFVLVRIFMWWITVFGTWVSFGIGCKITFDDEHLTWKEKLKVICKELKIECKKIGIKFKKIKSFSLSKIFKRKSEKLYIKHSKYYFAEWISIIISVALCIFLIILPVNLDDRVNKIAIVLFFVFFIGVAIPGIVIVKYIFLPNEERSIEKLNKNLKILASHPSACVSGHYGRMYYRITKEKLYIRRVAIRVDLARNDDYVTYFKEEDKDLKGSHYPRLSDPNTIRGYMLDRKKEQERLISEGLTKCKEELEERKRQQQKVFAE